MTDDDVSNMLSYYRRLTGHVAEMAANDIRQLSAEIDHQRHLNNQLADQSARLRAELANRGAVLAKIQTYAENCFLASIDKHARFCLGTISNMVKQCIDVERTCEATEARTWPIR